MNESQNLKTLRDALKISPEKILIALLSFFILSPKTADANAIWQAVLIERKYCWLIPVTLIIEAFFIYKFLIKDLKMALKVTLFMNVFSWVAGIFFMMPTVYIYRHVDPMISQFLNLYFYFVLYVVNALLEVVVVKRYMKTTPFFKILKPVFVANFITVSLSLLVMR